MSNPFGLRGYDAWKTRSPEDEYPSGDREFKCPRCGCINDDVGECINCGAPITEDDERQTERDPDEETDR